MVAAATAGSLLIGKVDGAVGGTGACRLEGIGVGRVGDRGEVKLAGVDRVGEGGFEDGEIEHSSENIRAGIVRSHPSDKNKDVARMGHPIILCEDTESLIAAGRKILNGSTGLLGGDGHGDVGGLGGVGESAY